AGGSYKYEHERGITHSTDRRDLSREKFRRKATLVDPGKAPVTVVPTPPPPPPAPPAPGAQAPTSSSWIDQFNEFATSRLGLTIFGVLVFVLVWRFFRS